jgi:endoglucanase
MLRLLAVAIGAVAAVSGAVLWFHGRSASDGPGKAESRPTTSTGVTSSSAATSSATTSPSAGVGLHSSQGKLRDASDREVRLTGVNWFGFETDIFAPHGLWTRNWEDMLDQIANAGFNSIRLPFSNQLLDPSTRARSIDYAKNPDLQGLNGLALMDKIIDGAGRRGLKVILDRHQPTAAARTELWYTDRVPESQWIADWTMLAAHYRGNATVIGADLHNEPHGAATWGDGNPRTDWRLAAERCGNAILDANPDWLVIVEGIENYQGDGYWWGGNLVGAGASPVRLSRPDKLVYSAHDYGPGVHPQPWFAARDFPDNLPAIWQRHWASLQASGAAPVLVGEFGGRSVGDDAEGTWQRSLVTFLRDRGISYCYWAWNPDSGDTGGILQDDWQSIDRAKLRVLAAYQWPRLASGPPS